MIAEFSEVRKMAAAVRAGDHPVVWLRSDGHVTAAAHAEPAGILPGSFNPLHRGHRALREAAAIELGGPVHFEMTLQNADKPPLEPPVVVERLRQFSQQGDLLALTNAATFAEKAGIFCDTAFVVGFDTAERILQARFYDGRPDLMQAALLGIRSCGCRFLVAGRTRGSTFATLSDLEIPSEHADLFHELPERRFRADVSSTNLRDG